MITRRVGQFDVSAIGLGAMPMSIEGRRDEQTSIATIHAALDAGVTLIDTADAYHVTPDEVGHNESLVAKALALYGDTSHVLVATKGGHYRPGDGSWPVNGDPEYLKDAAEASRRRLGVDAISLYQLHRPDPAVPFADSLGAIRDLLDAGTILFAGVSNVDVEQIDLAREILGDSLVSVQNQFSPSFRDRAELKRSRELGLAFIPWRPLGGISAAYSDDGDYSAFHSVAEEHGVSAPVVALAWHLAQGPHVIPVVGASRAASIRDSVTAVDLTLSERDLELLS